MCQRVVGDGRPKPRMNRPTPSSQPSPIGVVFYPPKFKGLSASIWACGFVPAANSLILNFLVTSFDHLGRFLTVAPVSRDRSLSLGDGLRVSYPPRSHQSTGGARQDQAHFCGAHSCYAVYCKYANTGLTAFRKKLHLFFHLKPDTFPAVRVFSSWLQGRSTAHKSTLMPYKSAEWSSLPSGRSLDSCILPRQSTNFNELLVVWKLVCTTDFCLGVEVWLTRFPEPLSSPSCWITR